ncbi:MAG: cysteine-rich CWC family protein [Psychromonas sp.]
MNTNNCPFCQQENRCNASNISSCWCQNEKIPASLIALLPLTTVNKSCICVSCVTSYKRDKQSFKARFNGQTQ